ncbi:MAG: hypothetical protein ACRCY9_16530, partial [Phycicoccus sp.]
RYLDAEVESIAEMFPALAGAPQAAWGCYIDVRRWPHILADALAALSAGRGETARDHLVALYLNRVMTYWEEIDGLPPAEVDALLDRQATDVIQIVAGRGVRLGGPLPPQRFRSGYWAEVMS